MKWRARLAGALALTILFLDTTVESVDAQVFIASNSRPEFWIAPLFVSATVTSEEVASGAGPVTVTVSWSVAPPANRTPAEIAQDLYLLWPGEVAGTPDSAGADPTLARQLEGLGFKIKEHGTLHLSARSRSGMGTGADTRTLGEAPFVTFGRPDGPARGARGATYIRIPWKPEMASVDWLAWLEMPARGLSVPRQVSWL